jgi:hypothetical protein
LVSDPTVALVVALAQEADAVPVKAAPEAVDLAEDGQRGC